MPGGVVAVPSGVFGVVVADDFPGFGDAPVRGSEEPGQVGAALAYDKLAGFASVVGVVGVDGVGVFGGVVEDEGSAVQFDADEHAGAGGVGWGVPGRRTGVQGDRLRAALGAEVRAAECGVPVAAGAWLVVVGAASSGRLFVRKRGLLA